MKKYSRKAEAMATVHNDDPSEYRDAYSSLDKSALVQESNLFNDKTLKEKKCIDLLNKIIFLLNQGVEFAATEKSQVFFNVTKSFQIPQSQRNKHYQNLRRLVYVLIKELRVSENEVFIVISCLSNDVQKGDNDVFKANALRVLTKIIEEQYVQNIEKFLRQGIIDKSQHVVSTAVISHIDLFKKKGQSAEVAKKSSNELQDKLFNSSDGYIQYQALLLLFDMKKHDNMASLKLIFQLTQKTLHSALVKCQLIRFIKRSLFTNSSIDQKTAKLFLSFIQSKLDNEDESVMFEAAKTLCELFEVYGQVVDVEQPFQVLTSLASSSSKPVNKYAALRVMNKIASQQPKLVGICQTELESLITDMNRSVASLAISTLLKTCNEDSVSKLIKQIDHYLPDLGIDFKIEIIQSTQLLYQRIPSKASVILKFLTDCLKEDGNIRFREAVVDTIMLFCPHHREKALITLAEHIEDCEHPHIQTKIISFLAVEGPKASNPQIYIRFIFNRINLERAVIRAAAVSALAAFANGVPGLKRSILHLLKKCLDDGDDEVRERAYFYIVLIEKDLQESIIEDELSLKSDTDFNDPDLADFKNFVFDLDTNIDVDALQTYLSDNKEALINSEEEVVIEATASVSKPKEEAKPAQAQASAQPAQPQQIGGISEPQAASQSHYLEELKNEEALSQFVSSHLYSTQPQFLTESDAEYVIVAIKHVFESSVIVQYEINNTIEDQILTNVQIQLSNQKASGVSMKGQVPLDAEEPIKCGDKKYAYVIFDKTSGSFPTLSMSQKMTFTITEIDVDTQEDMGSYEEEYTQIQDTVLSTKDYISSLPLGEGQFKTLWDQIGAKGNQEGTLSDLSQNFQLQFKTMQAAVGGLKRFFGSMHVCDGSDKINVTEKMHNLTLSGRFLGRQQVLVRAIIGFKDEYGCLVKMSVRSLSQEISQTLLECIN